MMKFAMKRAGLRTQTSKRSVGPFFLKRRLLPCLAVVVLLGILSQLLSSNLQFLQRDRKTLPAAGILRHIRGPGQENRLLSKDLAFLGSKGQLELLNALAERDPTQALSVLSRPEVVILPDGERELSKNESSTRYVAYMSARLHNAALSSSENNSSLQSKASRTSEIGGLQENMSGVAAAEHVAGTEASTAPVPANNISRSSMEASSSDLAVASDILSWQAMFLKVWSWVNRFIIGVNMQQEKAYVKDSNDATWTLDFDPDEADPPLPEDAAFDDGPEEERLRSLLTFTKDRRPEYNASAALSNFFDSVKYAGKEEDVDDMEDIGKSRHRGRKHQTDSQKQRAHIRTGTHGSQLKKDNEAQFGVSSETNLQGLQKSSNTEAFASATVTRSRSEDNKTTYEAVLSLRNRSDHRSAQVPAMEQQPQINVSQSFSSSWAEGDGGYKAARSVNSTHHPATSYGQCKLSEGKWIYDNSTRPLYNSSSCPFINAHQNCIKQGRNKTDYEKWRWQPNDCNLPIFDANLFLQSQSNRSMAFIGDSISRNMFESLACLLHNMAGLPDIGSDKNSTRRFTWRNTNFTLAFYRSSYLVEIREREKDIQKKGWLLELESLEKLWLEEASWYDTVVVNTGHWWTSHKLSKRHIHFARKGRIQNQMPIRHAYAITLNHTIHSLAQLTANAGRPARIILPTYSPYHFSGGNWYSGGKCHSERPMTAAQVKRHRQRTAGVSGLFNNALHRVTSAFPRNLDSASASSSQPLIYTLDITNVSDWRGDAHPGHFSGLADTRSDCAHWCLPGIPDTWNELLQVQLEQRV